MEKIGRGLAEIQSNEHWWRAQNKSKWSSYRHYALRETEVVD
jgi:hypothetical protein